MSQRNPLTAANKLKAMLVALCVPFVLVWGASLTIPSHDPTKLPFVLAVMVLGVAMVTLAFRSIFRLAARSVNVSFVRSLVLLLGCGFVIFGAQWLTAGALILVKAHHAGGSR
jgi:hypothetical protein